MSSDLVVHLRGGVYPLQKAVLFGPEDSGNNGFRVLYQAYPNETPVLSGFRQITHWKLHDARKNIFMASVGPLDFRQVYFDGVMGIRARFPNAAGADLGPYLRLADGDVKGKRYAVASEDWNKVASVADKSAIELIVHPHWIHHTARFESAEVQDKVVWITPKSPERAVCFNKPVDYYKGSAYFFENAYEFLDAEGEWFLDAGKQTLYFKPPTSTAGRIARIDVPVLGTLMEITGTADAPVHDLDFRGITFEGSNWTSPSKRGFVATQFAQPYKVPRTYENPDYPPGMIRITHAKQIAFRENVIRRAGATGLQLWADVDQSDIEGNQFTDIAANAIEIDAHSTKNPPPELQSEGIAIWNNTFRRAGCVYSNGGAILAHFVKGLIVDHNEIADMPYSGMQIGDQPKPNEDCGCTDNKVRFNHVHHTLLQHDDGGAIYTLGGRQLNSEIRENYIHDVLRSVWAGRFGVMPVYLDNYTQNILVIRNVIENCSEAARQVNHSSNNKLVENPPKDPAECQRIIDNAGPKPGYSPRKQSTATEPAAPSHGGAIFRWWNCRKQSEATEPAASSRPVEPLAEARVPIIRHIDPPDQGFFSKQLDFEGIPIKAHQDVDDAALLAGYDRLHSMFAHLGPYRESVLKNLEKARVELHIIGRNQVTTDLPEWQKDKGKPIPEYKGQTRDERTRGMGGRLVSCGEENLLRLANDRYLGRDICVHEFAHCVRHYGISPALRARFDEQFKHSLANGLWVDSYAGTNPDEFFAELSMWYFGTHGDLTMKGAKPKDGRQGLRDYDPEAYQLFDEFFCGKSKQ